MTTAADLAEILARVQSIQGDSTATEIPPDTRDLRPEVLGPEGRMRILPAAFWAETTMLERAMFGNLTGVYSFPTVELVEHLRDLIAGRTAIEIGAGHGVLADALGIPATDSRQQEKPEYRLTYLLSGQPPVTYGPNIIEIHASRAVRHYKPDVVIGCWVTHKYDPARHEAGGNEVGIDEWDILRNCGTYIAVGNEHVHKGKAIWTRRHSIEYPPFVYSRATNTTRDFIATWQGIKRGR